MDALSLRITEIFHSIQGESLSAGLPTVFVRLTGCPLRCQYCDTAYAFEGGERHTVGQIVSAVRQYRCPQVCITGGEPLAQPHVHALMAALADAGLQLSIETSGALPTDMIDPRVRVVLDLKTPGSGELERNLYTNIDHLKAGDEVKFVLCDRADYDWARLCIDRYQLPQRVAAIHFSPSQGQLDPALLAEWILQDRAQVRLQLQQHKIIWGDRRGV